MESQVMSEATSIARGTLESSMNYMNLGFTLVAAMAWADLARMLAKRVVKSGGNGMNRVYMYPLLVTLLAVVVFQMSRRVNPNVKRPVVVPVVQA